MDRRDHLGRRLGAPLLALLIVVVAGTLGYVLIEGFPVADALYMAVTTITTVGFGEIRPLSTAGRLFTIGLIVVGVSCLWYGLSVLVGAIVEGHLGQRWEGRRMERRIEQTRDHQIVCGYGRVGRQIAAALRREGRQVVVVDVHQAPLAQANQDDLPTVHGDATEDDTLRRAGIDRAAGLVTAVGSDADNVFVTLSARALRADLTIVARANEEGAAPKLRRAGATHVVSPYGMAGRQMARLALRPSSVAFVETLFSGDNTDLLLEDLQIAPGSLLAGLDVATATARHAGGAILLAVQRNGHLLAPPAPDLTLHPGDTLAVVGNQNRLRALERVCQGTAE